MTNIPAGLFLLIRKLIYTKKEKEKIQYKRIFYFISLK